LTSKGESIVNSARTGTQVSLIKILGSLSDEELGVVEHAMELLDPLFASQEKQPVVKE
jgi:hypothetical protein